MLKLLSDILWFRFIHAYNFKTTLKWSFWICEVIFCYKAWNVTFRSVSFQTVRLIRIKSISVFWEIWNFDKNIIHIHIDSQILGTFVAYNIWYFIGGRKKKKFCWRWVMTDKDWLVGFILFLLIFNSIL